jgi:hypothetical protein
MKGLQQLGRFYETGLDNLFVTSREPGAAEPSGRFTLFEGNLDRLPLAPYTLVTFSVDMQLEDSQALAVLSGAFSAPAASDALALGMRGLDVSLWLAPDIASGKEPPLRLSGELPPGLLPLARSHDLTLAAAGIAADVDGDGRDEALWLMPVWQRLEGPTGREAEGEGGYETCALVVYRIDYEPGAATGSAHLLQQLRLDEPCPKPELAAGRLRVDHPNKPDLILLTGDPAEGPRQPRVLLNDGAGGFSLEDSTLIAVPEQRDVRAVTIFPDGLRVAYVTAEGLYLARTKTDGRVYDSVERLASYRNAQSVAVTDVNGDTFTDIIVADAQGLWLTKVALR